MKCRIITRNYEFKTYYVPQWKYLLFWLDFKGLNVGWPNEFSQTAKCSIAFTNFRNAEHYIEDLKRKRLKKKKSVNVLKEYILP